MQDYETAVSKAVSAVTAKKETSSKINPAVKAIFQQFRPHPLKAFFKKQRVPMRMLAVSTGMSVASIHQYLNGYKPFSLNPALLIKLNVIADQIREAVGNE